MKRFLLQGRQRGQSIIEFAVIVPSFLLLMMLTIMGAMLMSDYLSMKHAADTAARVVKRSDMSINNKSVITGGTALLVCKDLDMTAYVVKKDSADTEFVMVEATAAVKIPFVKKYFLDNLTVYSAPEYKPASS